MNNKEKIYYTVSNSKLGNIIIATSDKGIVLFEFINSTQEGINKLKKRVPRAEYIEDTDRLREILNKILLIIDNPKIDINLPLDPRGSNYALSVWDVLSNIPKGTTITYNDIALKINHKGARGVAAAIASNGIAILIPCHRVIHKNGSTSGYRWGNFLKQYLLDAEK